MKGTKILGTGILFLYLAGCAELSLNVEKNPGPEPYIKVVWRAPDKVLSEQTSAG